MVIVTSTPVVWLLTFGQLVTNNTDRQTTDSIWTYRAAEWLIIANPGQLSTLTGIGEAAMPGKN